MESNVIDLPGAEQIKVAVQFRPMGDGHHELGVFIQTDKPSQPFLRVAVLGTLDEERKKKLGEMAIELLKDALDLAGNHGGRIVLARG